LKEGIGISNKMKKEEKFLLGICIGTSSTKALLVNTKGKIKGSSEIAYNTNYPFPNWAEQEPKTWLNSTIEVIKDLVGKSKINIKNILCIGFSGQMHSIVLLDRNNKVIRPSILWNDQRSIKECNYLSNTIGMENILKYTSNRPLNSFSLPKILWVKNNEPENFKKIRKFCLAKDYIKYMFSDVLSTDETDASGTLCFDVKKGKWSRSLLTKLGLNLSLMPDVEQSGNFSGILSRRMADMLNLPAGIPILAGVADTAGEMIGNGVINNGDCLVKLGTGGDLLVYLDQYLVNDGSFDLFRYPGRGFCSEQVVISLTASLNWGLDKLGLNFNIMDKNFDSNMSYLDYKKYIDNNKYDLLEKKIKEVPIGGSGLIFLPYLIGERSPHCDSKAKGALIGLNLKTNKNHIIRSIMEGTAFAQRDCYEVFKRKDIRINKLIISGGGSKSNLWCQIYSDVFNKKIIKMSTKEGASLGVCILGAVSLGLYSSLKDASNAFLSIEKVYSPIVENVKKYNEIYRVYNRLYEKLKDSFAHIHKYINKYPD